MLLSPFCILNRFHPYCFSFRFFSLAFPSFVVLFDARVLEHSADAVYQRPGHGVRLVLWHAVDDDLSVVMVHDCPPSVRCGFANVT